MWDVQVPIVGQCRQCGAELGTQLRIRATNDWTGRYAQDVGLRRRIDRSLVRLVVERHARHCPGQQAQAMPRATA